jgi:hypothetical protein
VEVLAWQPWDRELIKLRNPERVAPQLNESQTSQPLQGCEAIYGGIYTQGFRANPGLEFANAFSVIQDAIKVSP